MLLKNSNSCSRIKNKIIRSKPFNYDSKNTRFDKSDRLEDENDSSSDSEKDLKEFNPRRNF